MQIPTQLSRQLVLCLYLYILSIVPFRTHSANNFLRNNIYRFLVRPISERRLNEVRTVDLCRKYSRSYVKCHKSEFPTTFCSLGHGTLYIKHLFCYIVKASGTNKNIKGRQIMINILAGYK